MIGRGPEYFGSNYIFYCSVEIEVLVNKCLALSPLLGRCQSVWPTCPAVGEMQKPGSGEKPVLKLHKNLSEKVFKKKKKKSIGFESGCGFVAEKGALEWESHQRQGCSSRWNTKQLPWHAPNHPSLTQDQQHSHTSPRRWRECDFWVPARQQWQTCCGIKSRNTHQNTSTRKEWGNDSWVTSVLF